MKCGETNIVTDAKTLEGISKYTTTVVLRAIVNNISYTKFDQNPFFFQYIDSKTSRQLRPVILLKFASSLYMYVGK